MYKASRWHAGRFCRWVCLLRLFPPADAISGKQHMSQSLDVGASTYRILGGDRRTSEYRSGSTPSGRIARKLQVLGSVSSTANRQPHLRQAGWLGAVACRTLDMCGPGFCRSCKEAVPLRLAFECYFRICGKTKRGPVRRMYRRELFRRGRDEPWPWNGHIRRSGFELAKAFVKIRLLFLWNGEGTDLGATRFIWVGGVGYRLGWFAFARRGN